MFVFGDGIAAFLLLPACSVWACGVGGLLRHRYSLHVRAVVRPSHPAYYRHHFLKPRRVRYRDRISSILYDVVRIFKRLDVSFSHSHRAVHGFAVLIIPRQVDACHTA